ncbi:MAG: mechanosensitive ion channel [Alphaproteobacteria bacterium]|nr:mechanosensitive ion channel [Alphaproteobacteria bacterium]
MILSLFHAFIRFRAHGLWHLGCAMLFMIFSCGTSVMAAKTNPKKAAPVASQSLKKAVAEVKALQAQLEAVQKRLPVILDQLGISATVGKGTELKATAVVTGHLEHFSQHFRQRLSKFSSDFALTTQMLGQYPVLKNPIKLHFLFLFAAFVVSLFSVGLGARFLQHRIEKSVFRLKFKSLMHLGRLNSLLLFPIPVYFCISLALGGTMGVWGIKPLDGWGLNTCALFPLHFYCVWAMYTWIGMTWMPNRPSQGFVVMRPEDAHRTAFWLRTVIGIYAGSVAILGIIGLIFVESSEKDAVIRTILDVAVMASCWCGYKGLSLDRAALELNSDPKNILRVIAGFRWLFAVMTVLFVMERDWFLYFLFPVVMTAMVWIFLFPTKEMLRYYRLRFLWKRRHKDFLFKPVLLSDKILSYMVDTFAYGLLLSCWYPYIEMWIGAGYWTFLTSVKSFVFSGLFNAVLIVVFSYFIIKIGDRILRYYVEEKYTSDSLENNFLASRLKTLMAMLRTSLRVVVWTPTVVFAVGQFADVNVGTWVTSIGAASFGLSFGVQNIVRDFITGFFIILENNLMVGDEVDVDSKTGKVESITIRTLKIRSDQGMLLTIPFGSIQVIGNKNRLFSAVLMNISVGYSENLDRVQLLIEKAFTLVKRVPIFGRRILGPLEIRGVNEVTSYSVILQVKITTAPNMQDVIRRAYNRQLKQLFDEAGIVVPLPPASFSKPISSLTNTSL